MMWRLICDKCTRKLGEEIKSVGILKNPDLRCAGCGIYIRESADDREGLGKKWFPVSEDQLARARALSELEPDRELHYNFALDDDEKDLGKAQDEICSTLGVRCTAHKCGRVDLGVHVVQIYMDPRPSLQARANDATERAERVKGEHDHTSHPVFAGTVWRHDRWPSDFDIALALRLWRGPGGPEFLVKWYKEEGVAR